MRRIVFVIVLICMLGGVVYYRHVFRSQDISPAEFLPENVLLYVHQHNFADQYGKFVETMLGQTIDSLNYVELALDLDMPLEIVNLLRETQDFALSPEAALFFEEFFSNDTALALLDDPEVDDYTSYIKKSLILFTEPVHNTRAFDFVMKGLGTQYNISTSQYGKHIIYRLQPLTELTVSIASVGKKTIFALDERTLRSLLDRYDLHENNLTENYFFAEFQRKNKNIQTFSYFEIGPLLYHLKNILKSYTHTPDSAEVIDMWKGFTAGIFSSSLDGDSVKSTIDLHYNPHWLDNDILYFLQILPEKDRHIEKSPRDTLLYFWMNTFDIRRLWELHAKTFKIDPLLLQGIEENIALTAGLPFEDLLDLIGNRIHFMLRQPSPVDPVPLPNFTIIFELTDRGKAKSALQHLFLLNKIPHGNDIYRDIPFTFWGNDMQSGLQPVYAIHGNSLYISSSVKMQLDVIDALYEDNGMTSVYPFRSVGQTLLGKNNSSGYIRVEKMIEFVKKFLSLGEAMYSRQNRAEAYRTKTFVYEILFPVLDGLKMFSSITTKSSFEVGKLNIEIYLNQKDM